MLYIEIDADLATMIAREMLKVKEIGVGPKGGHYIINEHNKKRYFKSDKFRNKLIAVAKRNPQEIADAVMNGMKGWKSLNKKQQGSIGKIASGVLDESLEDPKTLDALDAAANKLTTKQQKQILDSGVGNLVIANSKAGKALAVKKDTNNAPASSNNLPSNIENDEDNDNLPDSSNPIDTTAVDVTHQTPSTGLLRGVGNLLMRATLLGLAVASWALGTNDFSLKDAEHSKSYVNVIHDQFVNHKHRAKKRLNYFIKDPNKKLDETPPDQWANDEDINFFNMDKE